MEYTPGMILEGTVKTITGFGAFIQLPDGQTGLVHISEVAFSYVSDIHQHLTEGQTVRVKVLTVGEGGRLSLSVKQAAEKPAAPKPTAARRPKPAEPKPDFYVQPARQEPSSFEDKLKQFMADSNSKISGVRQYEHRTRSRKR